MKQQKKIHRVFINSSFNTDIFTCSHELSHRIKNVLRIKENGKLIIFNDKKEQYLCSVKYENKIVILLLKNKITLKQSYKKNISLAVSIVSMKVMDLIIQKSVELDVSFFHPIYTNRSQYKDIQKKISHWEKIIVHATEQSGRCELMKMYPPLALNEYISSNSDGLRYILHQNGKPFTQDELSKDNFSFFIGPEGGFDDEELDIFEINEWKMKKISENILRTETACISIATLINNYESFSRNSL
jgi:16S rRNA (uracil1498-N3)-methyltransferase